MPIYEYRCEKCGEFEETQRITDPPLDRCPTCRRKVRRLISNTSFQLKGGGWYVTDYARAGKKGDDGASKGESSSDKSSDKAESKSTTKSDGTGKSDKASKSSKSDTKSAAAGT
jgi:putative FmdB family regulatory protein